MEHTLQLLELFLTYTKDTGRRYEAIVNNRALIISDFEKQSRFSDAIPAQYIFIFDPVEDYEKLANNYFLEFLAGLKKGAQ